MKNAIKVLVFTVLVIAVCAGAIAGYIKYNDVDFEYVNGTKEGTVEIVSYIGDSVNIIIPQKIKGKTVAYIGKSAFEELDIVSVTIPDTVITIEEKAFFKCEKLETVHIGSAVETIKDSAFANCTSLKSVNIPAALKNLGNAVFLYCNSLQEPELENGASFVMKDGILFDTKITTAYWINSKTDLSSYTFPSSVNKYTSYLFTGHNEITTFSLSENTAEIPDALFLLCSSLQNVTIPNSVTKIGDAAFLGCEKLKTLTVLSNVKTIGQMAFPGMGDDEKKSDFKLKLEANSAAHQYADKFEITYDILP